MVKKSNVKKNGKKSTKSKVSKKGGASSSLKTTKNKQKNKNKKNSFPVTSSSTSIEDLIKLEESIEARAKAKSNTKAAFDKSRLAVEIATETLLRGGDNNISNNNNTNANNYNLSSIDVFEESLASFQKNTQSQPQPYVDTTARSQSPLSSTISTLNNNPYYGGLAAGRTTMSSQSPTSSSTLVSNKTKQTKHNTTKKTKKMTASQQRKRSHFHYLGGSVSLQAERERRMELEQRLMDARDEVRKQAQTLQPTVEALVGAVRAIEAGADEQLLLADETQKTFESLRNEISTLKHELKKDIRKSKDQHRKLTPNPFLARV
jgi:hypothetical protein